MASVAIFNFLGLWNQFLLPVALNTNQDNYVLAQGMAAFASQAGYAVDFGALFAAVVITVVPVLIVYIIFQRQLEGSVSQGTFRCVCCTPCVIRKSRCARERRARMQRVPDSPSTLSPSARSSTTSELMSRAACSRSPSASRARASRSRVRPC